MESHKCLSQKNGERACGCEWVSVCLVLGGGWVLTSTLWHLHSTLSPGQVSQRSCLMLASIMSIILKSVLIRWQLIRLQCGHHYKTTRSFTRTKGGAALCGWDYRPIQATPPPLGGWWGTEGQRGGPWNRGVAAVSPSLLCFSHQKHQSASMTLWAWHSGSSPQRSVGG